MYKNIWRPASRRRRLHPVAKTELIADIIESFTKIYFSSIYFTILHNYTRENCKKTEKYLAVICFSIGVCSHGADTLQNICSLLQYQHPDAAYKICSVSIYCMLQKCCKFESLYLHCCRFFCKICNCGFYIHWLFPLFSLICRKCQGFVFSLRLGLHCELQHASGARTWIIATDWG